MPLPGGLRTLRRAQMWGEWVWGQMWEAMPASLPPWTAPHWEVWRAQVWGRLLAPRWCLRVHLVQRAPWELWEPPG